VLISKGQARDRRTDSQTDFALHAYRTGVGESLALADLLLCLLDSFLAPVLLSRLPDSRAYISLPLLLLLSYVSLYRLLSLSLSLPYSPLSFRIAASMVRVFVCISVPVCLASRGSSLKEPREGES